MYVLATFPDRASAEHAMRDLEGAGFGRAGMTLALNSQPDSIQGLIQGGALLTVDAGERDDDARMLLRQNNAINLQDAGEVVPLATHTPLSATPTGPANAAAPNQAEPTLPSGTSGANPPANAAANIEQKAGTGALGSANVIPPAIPIVTPPPSALGGMNVLGPDLTTLTEAVNTEANMGQSLAGHTATPQGSPEAAPAEAAPSQEPRVSGLDPAASADALAGGGGLLPPVDDPNASENTNPEMHPTT